jgi:circadian clock protein KaiB
MSLSSAPAVVSPTLFKGIALFTPGGDLIYCIDHNKQNHWHLHLCAALQELLDLPEPPHFLVPCYTATVDRWFDAATRQIRIAAEASSAVLRFQPLLNAIFDTGDLDWSVASQPEGCVTPWCWTPIVGSFRNCGKPTICWCATRRLHRICRRSLNPWFPLL